MNSEQLVTIATFYEPMQAHLVQARLEVEEIDSYLIDEHIVGTYWLWAVATGGVKLQVQDTDVRRAKEILQEIREKRTSKEEPKNKTRCPECGSFRVIPRKNTKRNFWNVTIFCSIIFIIVLLVIPEILGIPLIFWFILLWIFQEKEWLCLDCKYIWRGRKLPFPK